MAFEIDGLDVEIYVSNDTLVLNIYEDDNTTRMRLCSEEADRLISKLEEAREEMA